MKFQKWIDVMHAGWRWCLTTVIAPMLRWMAGLMLRWAAAGADRSHAPEQWKQEAMDDFSAWLTSLPDAPPGGEPGLDACDLYTLLTEFAALRQEIKLQNRQQRTVLRDQETLTGRFQSIGEQLEARIVRLDQVHDALRRDIEVKAVLPFLDVRDALLRGETAARAAAKPRGLWRRSPKGMDAVVEGYAMGVRRFDRSLNLLGVEPIATVDRPFDATRMRAVDKRFIADKAPGIVLEEILGGFMRNGKVLRTADVVVNSK
jgi:molecular chaperone GrpE (heat shock protein)